MPQGFAIPTVFTLRNGNHHLVSILNLRGAKNILLNLAVSGIAIRKMQLHTDRFTTSIHTRLMNDVVSSALIGIIPLFDPHFTRPIVSAIFLSGSLHIAKSLIVLRHHLVIVVNTHINSIAQVIHSLVQIHPRHHARHRRHRRRRRATRLTHYRSILRAKRRKVRRRAGRRALRRHRRLTAIATRLTRHRIIQTVLHFNIPP